MPGKIYSAGTAFITVVPSFLGIEDAFKRQVRDMAKAADKDIAAGMANGLKEANRQAKDSGARAGKDFGGAYETEAKKALNAAWRSLPEPKPGVDLGDWEKGLTKVRSEMKELSTQRIGFDIDQKTFDKAVQDFRRRLEELRNTAAGVNKSQNVFDTSSAIGNLDNLQAFTRDATRQAGDAGEQAGSAFNDRMARALRDGLSRIPPIKLTADSSDAEVKISEVQQRMVALQNKRIGIDIDAGAAYAELVAINNELKRLDRTNVRVDIRTNAHEAAAGMSAFITQAEQAGQATENIGTRANFSLSRLEYLIALGVSLGSAIVPAALAAAGAIGLIGTAAAAGVAGVGVFALGVSGVAAGVKALDGYQKDQAKSANSVDQAQRKMSSSTDAVRQAQASLANTRRTVSQGQEDAARRVTDAERGLADTRRSAARDLATEALAVRDAQRAVTDAEKNARDVRLALNDAIAAATRDMQELDVALARNNVDQQKAVTAQMDALNKLNALRMNPRATEVELRQAKDVYDEQTVQLLELRQKHKELSEDKAKADRLGVEGDTKVIAVRKQIADADDRVAKAREKLAREQDQQRESEYQGQQRIAAAERQAADARRQQARQQQDGQFQLQQASNAVTQAQRAQQQAWEKTGLAGGDALQTLNQQMGQLSPAAQHFAKFLFGLKDEVLQLRAAAAEPLLPQLESAIKLLLPYLPAVERFVGKIANAMGGLAVKAVQALGDPVWQRFFGYIDKTAVPALDMLYTVGQNVAQGLISLFLALTPFNGSVGTGLVDLSRDFALWAERLNKSAGYQQFLQYVTENGPRVVHFLGEIGLLLIDLVKAAAPLGSLVLRGLTLLVDVINSIPLPALTALVFAIGAVALGMTTLGGVMRALKFKDQLTDIFGSKASKLVQTYATETGRAAAETAAFGKATAATVGVTTAASARMQNFAAAVGSLPSRLTTAAVDLAPLAKNLDTVGRSAAGSATAVDGPRGLSGAMQAATGRIAGLGTAAATAASGGLSKVRTAVFDIAAATNGPGGLAAGAATAAGKVGGLAKAAGSAATMIGGKLMGGLSSAVSLLGGPWGVALLGATLAIGYFTAKAQQQQQKVDSLKSVLAALSGEYRDLSLTGKQAGVEADTAFRNIVKNNPDMQRAVIQLDKMGVSFQQMMQAAVSGDPSQVIARINTEITRLNAEIATTNLSAALRVHQPDEEAQQKARTAQVHQLEALRDAYKQNASAIGTQNTAMQLMNGQMATTSTAVDLLTPQEQALADAQLVLADSSSTAQQKMDALTKAQDLARQSVIDANEADESWEASLDTLTTSVNNAKAAHDADAKSLSIHTATGRSNRDMLEALIGSADKMYDADVALNGVTQGAIDKGKGHYDQIRAVAKQLGLGKAATEQLITAYGKIPPTVETAIGFKAGQFDAMFAQLEQAAFIQKALKNGTDIDKARADYKAMLSDRNRAKAHGWATGGPIQGPGIVGGPTEDANLIWASKGEWMQPADAVDYYGAPAMEAIRQKKIPKEMFQGLAAGGAVRAGQKWPFNMELKAKIPSLAELSAAVMGTAGSTFTGLSADASVRKMQQWALAQAGKRYLWSAVGPAMYDCSGLVGNLWAMATGHSLYHRYMSTGDMGPGKHGMVSGPGKKMTIYLGPGHTAANVAGLHAEAYGGNGTPLAIGHVGTPLSYYNQKLHIPGFAGGGLIDPDLLRTDRDRMISFLRFGWPEPPTQAGFGDLLDSPLVAGKFDDGGMIPPGYSAVVNGTGRPEPVLSRQQWNDISALARGGDGAAAGPRTINQFEFRDTTLDAGKLRVLQDQEAALARQGRAR